MTNKEKAKELASLLVGEDQNNQPLIDVLLDMAEWKETQVKELSKTQHVDKTCKEKCNSLTQKPVSEYLEKAANEYIGQQPLEDYKPALYKAFIAGAKWQEEKDKQILNEEGVVVLPEEEFERMKRSLIKLAEREQQMMAKAIAREVKVDAGGYPYIPQMELYDYDKNVPLAKGGDNVKVIVIKED